MEKIGKTLKVKQKREVEVTEDATHFNLLQVVFRVPQHEVDAEVCLMDAEGNAIGGARWVRLNPLEIDEHQSADNWAQIAMLSFKDLGAKVKAALQKWEL